MIGLIAALSLAASPEDALLEKLFKSYLDRLLKQCPAQATQLGDHRFDHLLDDLSPDGLKSREAMDPSALASLRKEIDKSKLSRAAQIDYEILEQSLLYGAWKSENERAWEANPLAYNELISDSVYLLFTQSTQPREVNIRNAAERIKAIPSIVAAARRMLKSPPRVYTETAIARNRGAIAFYESGIFELSGEVPVKSPLKAPCARAVAALKEYQEFLEKELLPRSKGEWRLGKEKFARKLEMELGSGRSAAEVYRDAEEEAKRVTSEMYVVARQLWHRAYPREPLPPDDPDGRRQAILKVLAHFNKDHGKVDGLLDEARDLSKKLRAFIKEKDILRLPDPDQCKIIEMPEFQRGYSVAYLNPAPPLDPKASSFYAISPPPAGWDARKVESYLQEYNRAMMAILTIHEAYPGHYVQLEYANRHPSLIRRVLQSGVFCEGWAVYTEQMMLDQGFGGGDLVLRLNQLKFYLRAVINALLDHEMHCKEMTDEQAMDLLVKRGFQSEGEALGKVTRAKLSSCQLSTYFVGRMAFYNLRRDIQKEMGPRFSLGRFHEAVLAHGSLPVKYLPELTRQRLKEPR
jgi:uncharacterized protein (DUF885 family)